MKVRIEKKGDYFKQLIYDLSTDQFEFYVLSDLGDSILRLPFNGFYDIIESHLIILYKNDYGNLSLKIDDLSFSIANNFSLSYNIEEGYGALTVEDEYSAISIKYNLSEIFPISTLYYDEIEEDKILDFGCQTF